MPFTASFPDEVLFTDLHAIVIVIFEKSTGIFDNPSVHRYFFDRKRTSACFVASESDCGYDSARVTIADGVGQEGTFFCCAFFFGARTFPSTKYPPSAGSCYEQLFGAPFMHTPVHFRQNTKLSLYCSVDLINSSSSNFVTVAPNSLKTDARVSFQQRPRLSVIVELI